MRFIDISGRKYGRLTALSRSPNKGRRTMWACECECGTEVVIDADHLRSGHTISCGCAWHDKCVAHGHTWPTQSRTYKAWANMRSRVKGLTPSYKKNWQERGIIVCQRWETFSNFLEDMGECPDGLTLERIDNNGNYEKSNCEWASRQAQCQNTRRTIHVTVGSEKLCLKEACRRLGLNYSTVHWRIQFKGMKPQEAIVTSLR